MRISPIFRLPKKITEFEYWPYGIFYIPLYFYGFYLAFKARSLMYFSTANPAMKYGGVMGESKMKVLNYIHKEYLPKTLFFEANTTHRQVVFSLHSNGMSFPIIAKPNIGERGKNVEKIEDESKLVAYLATYPNQDFIIQEFVEAPIELGILYYRFPHEDKGHISSVVLKEFLAVEGDGKASLKMLIGNNDRAKNRQNYLFEKYATQLDVVLPKGKKFYLEPIGNHCRGTKFLNGNHLINEQLVEVFDQIAANINGFNYGRFDLKVSSLDALYRGEGIKILELNGVSSEPAHIYDPNTKLLKAYKDLFFHASLIQKIGVANHKKGLPYSSLKTFLGDLMEFIFPHKRNTKSDIKIPHSGIAQN